MALYTPKQVDDAVKLILSAADRANVDPLALTPQAVTLAAAMYIASQTTGQPMTLKEAIAAMNAPR